MGSLHKHSLHRHSLRRHALRRHSLRRQRGMGALGWIMIVLLIAIVARLTIVLTPHLITFNAIQSTIDGLDRETLRQAKPKIMASIDARLKINSIYDMKAKDILTLEKDADRATFSLDYRVDEPLFSMGFSQLGIYLHFEREITRALE